ncbi:SUMF1/EgtB/PvdO family nonheme iron enzyme [Sneathiella sp. P13V-1]|uniref:SUMF1/EgtB/PvdO family nonheme iron enzyme n=1 Tax=Sneathiella sp. P13V-1 TaxID=2697366 RepID=UPI00187B7184|nr:SUMF1/EgtB/PvdO family nonheme iron enzyme [Sneathiella sp. P13V-1]MBE7638670.1 SUMF1/EgtB/PvdO family nonheme iron enzyme [Sneathiella sp. P13V-1]
MSEFKEQLEQAARRQQVLLVTLVSGLVVVAGAIFILLFLLKTTILKITPDDARPLANVSVEGGIAFYAGDTLFSFTRFPEIRVQADGFKPLEKTVEPEEENTVLEIALEEKPAILKLRVVAKYTDVSWRLNDTQFASGDVFEQELQAGDYDLEITHPYLLPHKETLKAGRGEVIEKDIQLSSVKGTIGLSVDPDATSVTLNGEPISNLPYSAEVDGGSYDVEVAKQGYQTIRENLEITNTRTEIVRNYRLELQPASLRVKVSPEDGKLTLNGKEISPEKRLTVTPGRNYYLKYTKEGYGTQEQKLVFKPAESKDVDLSLKLQIGEVRITSTPVAEVMIEGKPYGKTPITLRLPAYRQGVKAVRQGYASQTKIIKPSPNGQKKVHFNLKTEKEAKLAAAKPKYITKAGQVMVLFKPNEVVMGAPRDQKGQRANEFIRKVTLRRHFYASESEVTISQFSGFKKSGGNGNLPVVGIEWNTAAVYCNWLSRLEGISEFYKIKNGQVAGFDKMSNGYRLLTEAEWEWLARKAGKSKQTIFHWGDKPVVPKDAGNVADESAKGKARFYIPNYVDKFAGVAPVKSFPPEKSGLYDMFGNVSEWVHDYYSLVPPNETDKLVDPMGDAEGYQHMTKGANFNSGNMTEIRPAYRAPAKEAKATIGFRIGRYLYGEEE